jgi:hypothetical protein
VIGHPRARRSVSVLAVLAVGSIVVQALSQRAAAAPWQLTLRAPKPAAVFDVAEGPHVTAVIRNVEAADEHATISVEVTDQGGRRLVATEVVAAVPKGETRETALLLGDPARLPHDEYLALRVTLTAGGRVEADWRKGFGFLPRRTATTPPDSSPFGLLADYHWPLLQRLGVRYVRPNWSWDERPMDWAKRHGVAYCPLVNEANAFVRGELTEAAYADFVYQSVSRYKRYVHYWQLGNEFDVFHREGPRAFVEAQRIGYAAAKRADPGCIVVGGSITELQCRKEAWPESLDLGLAKYCDVYDFHFYQDLAATQALLDYIHATCRERHAEKPIWVTETTQVGMSDPDDRNQADYVFKRYAHLLANGVSVVMWHCYAWPYPFEADKTAATALVDHDGFARPSLFAYAAITEALEGARFAKRWEAGEKVYALEFRRGQRAVAVLWSEGGDRALRLRLSGSGAVLLHPSGHREPLQPAAGSVVLAVRKSPVILEASGPVTVAEWKRADADRLLPKQWKSRFGLGTQSSVSTT